ncbi:MAG: efflux RND transporter periplasmic adaptor subunit [Chromatiales bacterium]|nr:efflux RND transporter periplasmic adaptor subunit [Chromatiales bacterium]
MRPAVVIATGVATLLLATGAWWGWTRLAADDAATADRTWVTPERRKVGATVLATGILRTRVGGEVRVGAQLSGIVEKLNVVVGSKISKGDVIATIDARPLKARLAQARAQIAVAEQELKRAEVELARSERLDQQRLVARSDVEDKSLAVSEARARLEKARRDAAVVETDLNYAVIQSPITGTVASVTTQEGETVAASFNAPTFATIIEDGALELIALVDETDIGNVAVGNPVSFTVESFPALEFAGRVERIAPKGTIISGVVNFEVMISIESPVEQLKPDMTTNVSIRTAERETLVLPSAAIQKDDSGRYVWVEKGGELQRRTVTVGARDAGITEIREGVVAGDRVLLSPLPATAREAS